MTAPSSAMVRTLDFDGHPVPAFFWRGNWWWIASMVAEAIGYAQPRKLVGNVAGAWSREFIEGRDHLMVAGDDLREIRELCTGSVQTSKFAGRLLILSMSGIDLALVLSRTEQGRKLRRILADEVLPQLRATGTATLPGAPVIDVAALVRDAVAEQVGPIVRELTAMRAQHVGDGVCLGARVAEDEILKPLRLIARRRAVVDPIRGRAAHCSRMHVHLREALGMGMNTAFAQVPVGRLSDARVWVAAQRRDTDDREAMFRHPQLTLVPKPRAGSTG